MIFKKNRRGEMTSQQIVILIILIASFAVLLFFLFRLNLGSETEKEVCHNSVVARGSSVIPTEAVPLDCKRSYVCITEDGTCESMTKPIKKKVGTTSINTIIVKNIDSGIVTRPVSGITIISGKWRLLSIFNSYGRIIT